MSTGNGKKSQTGSVNSRLSHNHQQHYHQAGGGSGATSGAGSDKSGVPGSSSSPQHAHTAASSTAVGLTNVLDVIDVLYGGSAGSGAAIMGLSRSNLATHHRVTSSGGASTYSGGGGGPPGLTNGSAVGGGGLQLTSSPCASASASASAAPPAYNVAMAMVMLHQRTQALIEAQAEQQQRLFNDFKEELSSLRGELVETRGLVNTMTVEIDSMRVSRTRSCQLDIYKL